MEENKNLEGEDLAGTDKNSFKAIESQEQLDSIIKDRLDRERKKSSEATAGLQKELDESKSINDELKAKIEKFDLLAKENEDLKASVKKYETDSVKTRISLELGMPLEMASRLRGETEEEIKADAEILMKALPTIKKSAPQKGSEPTIKGDDQDSIKSGLAEMLEKINENRK